MSVCMSHEETFAIKGLWWAKLKQSFSDFEIPMNSGHFRSPLFCSSNLVLRKIKLLSRLFKRSWVLVAGGGIRHRCWSLTGFILFHWNVKDPFHPRRVKTVRALSSVPFFFFFLCSYTHWNVFFLCSYWKKSNLNTWSLFEFLERATSKTPFSK